MALERYQRRETLDNLDKVEPYGANAEARAASETANLLARTTGQFARLLGNQAEKMAIQNAKRAAFTIDPESGAPMLPKEPMIGGLIATEAYQRAISQRYEASIRDSLNQQLMKAATDNLENEEGFRQDMAIVVGAMAEKIDPQYQTFFTEMASSAIAEHTGKMAYSRASKEAAAARAAYRSNAAANAKRSEDQAVFDAAPETAKETFAKLYRETEAYKELAAVNIEMAEDDLKIFVRKEILNRARYNKTVYGEYAYPDITPSPPAPEVGDTMIEGMEAPAPATYPAMSTTVLDDVDIQLMKEAGITAAPVRTPGMADDSEGQREAGQPDLVVEPMAPPLSMHGYEMASGRNVFGLRLYDEEGKFNKTAYDRINNSMRLAARPYDMAVSEFSEMGAKEQAEFYANALPWSDDITNYFNAENFKYSNTGPVGARFIDFMKDGYLPPAVGNFFTNTLASAENPQGLRQAAFLWQNVGHSASRAGSWAAKHPELAGTLDVLSYTIENSGNVLPEELDRNLERVRTLAMERDDTALLKALGEEYKGDHPHVVLNSKINQLVTTEIAPKTSKIANAFSVGNLNYSPDRAHMFAPERVPDINRRVKAVMRAMEVPNAEEALQIVLNNNFFEEDGFVDGMGNPVKGILKDDYPTIYTQTADNPVELLRVVAAKSLNNMGITADADDRSSLQLMPTETGYIVMLNGEQTALELDMNSVRKFVQGYEAIRMGTMPEEYGELMTERNMLTEEIVDLWNDGQRETEIADMKLNRIKQLHRMMLEISGYNTLDYLRDLPDSSFVPFTQTGVYR